MAETAKKILVVDDEPGICEGVEMVLTRAGFAVKKSQSAEEALKLCDSEEFDLILMDIVMPGMDGADACAEIKRRRPESKVMAISGSPAGKLIESFVRAGGLDTVLIKPFGKEELLEGVRGVLG